MPQEISKITLPSGNTYDIKDAVARQAIAGGVSFIVAWNGSSTPVVGNIPAGVVVTYNDTDYTGTFAANSAQAGAFYLVHSSSTTNDVYDEYVAVGTSGSKSWEKLGSSNVDLSDLGALAYKDNVTASPSAVSFSGGTTDTFVKSYPGSTSKLQTTTVPNVTSAGSASTWGFALGTGDDAETLIISGGNGTAPTLGTAKTVATGSVASSGGGATVMTGLGTPTTESAVTSIGTGTAAAQNLTIS